MGCEVGSLDGFLEGCEVGAGTSTGDFASTLSSAVVVPEGVVSSSRGCDGRVKFSLGGEYANVSKDNRTSVT